MRPLIIGVGRRGGDCLAGLGPSEAAGLDLLFADTDTDDLDRRPEGRRLRLGAALLPEEFTRNDATFSYKAALAERGAIEAALAGHDALLLVAGLGGGTGAGASRALAELARERGMRVLALTTRPFLAEGERRLQRARLGARALADLVDLAVPFHQDQLLPHAGRSVRVRELVSIADQVVRSGVVALADLLAEASSWPALGAALGASREGLFGVGASDAPEGLEEAARFALASPFLDGVPLDGTRGLLVSLRSRAPLPADALERACRALRLGEGRPEAFATARVVPDLENAYQLSVYLVGVFGEPRPRLEGFYIPGPTG